MTTVMVIDDMAICREPIAAVLRQEGYDVLCAGSGQEAFQQLQEKSPDLILLDVAMPDLDGLAFLKIVRRNPSFKNMRVLLLTAVAERDYVMTARDLGVQGYLLKSQFSLSEMLNRVKRCLNDSGPYSALAPVAQDSAGSAGSPVRTGKLQVPESVATTDLLGQLKPIITKEELIFLVNQGLELRPLAPVVQNVISTTLNPKCSIDDVADAVSKDQALSIRVLKVANGSIYGSGRPVNTVRDAISRIGTQEVRKLVTTLGVVQQYEGRISQHIDPRGFWEHATACGVAASGLARLLNLPNMEDFFLWGIVHDLGRLILLEHLPDRYARVWEVAARMGVANEVAEARMLMLDHGQVLERALDHWRFPREFIVPVVNHHQSVARLDRLGPDNKINAAVVALADRLAHTLLLGDSGNPVIYPIEGLVEMLGLPTDCLAEFIEEIPSTTNSMKWSLLARSGNDPWPDYSLQLRDKLHQPVHALCASLSPETDAYQMFFNRIGSTAGDHNLGVVYLSDVREQARVLSLYDDAERQAGSPKLPVLIVYSKGKPDEKAPWFASRRYATLRAPCRVEALVGAANRLLG